MMKIEITDVITDPGSTERVNEDQYLLCEGLAVVMDGATGLGSHWVEHADSDAKWFVDTLKEGLRREWRSHRAFMPALQAAISATCDMFSRYAGNADRPRADERPSAAMTALAIENGAIRLFQAGDCMAFYKQAGAITRPFPASPLEALDRASVEAMKPYMDQGMSPAEARNQILPLLRRHRALVNEPRGYSALTPDMDCTRHVTDREITPAFNSRLIMASDGFSALVDYEPDWERRLFEVPLRKALAVLRRIEREDPALQKHPRLKVHDDATAVRVVFG